MTTPESGREHFHRLFSEVLLETQDQAEAAPEPIRVPSHEEVSTELLRQVAENDSSLPPETRLGVLVHAELCQDCGRTLNDYMLKSKL